LVAKLSKMKVALSAGLRDGYLLVGIGPSTDHLEKLGRGPLLLDRTELKPLVKHLDRRLTSIYYASTAAQAATAPDKKAIDKTFRWLLAQLKEAGLPKDLNARLRQDCRVISRDLAKFVVAPGPLLTFSFRTDEGGEHFTYDWAKSPLLKETRPLTLFEHMGGEPLFMCAGRSPHYQEKYRLLVKWLNMANGYVDQLVLPNLEDKDKKRWQESMTKARPILSRLDEVTGRLLLPALPDGQSAFVIDARLKSKRWHAALPRSANPLTLPEPAVIVGVSDAGLLRKAFAEYRSAANDLLSVADEESELHIPPPAQKRVTAGDLFYYSLPHDLGLDKQLAPTAGLGKHVAVLTLSKKHAERLLTSTPLKIQHGPFAELRQPVTEAFYLDWPGMLQVLRPWIRQGMRDAKVDRITANQVEEVLRLLEFQRRVASITYVEGGALVTHAETVYRDVP
jgi:hypothetical protein